MSHSGATIVINTVVYYGEYNGTSDFIIKQFYKTPEERDLFWRKDNPKTVNIPTPEMINRSILVDMEATYGSGIEYDVLFDPITLTVIYNQFNDFDDYNDYDSKTSREDAMKQAALKDFVTA